MKEKADTPEKKEQHQDGVIRASRAMNQSNYMVSMRGFVPRFYTFWTLLTSKLSFWTYYAHGMRNVYDLPSSTPLAE